LTGETTALHSSRELASETAFASTRSKAQIGSGFFLIVADRPAEDPTPRELISFCSVMRELHVGPTGGSNSQGLCKQYSEVKREQRKMNERGPCRSRVVAHVPGPDTSVVARPVAIGEM
jgi:hypothetical protein